MPIMLAQRTRSHQAKVAQEVAKTGFLAVKRTKFHGVRLHLNAHKQTNCLPPSTKVWLNESNVHDLTALKQIRNELPKGINLFGDKAYADESFKRDLTADSIFSAIKKPKKVELTGEQKHFNKTVSTFRQPVESFFKLLIDKTDIQRLSQIRSTEGLIIHC